MSGMKQPRADIEPRWPASLDPGLTSRGFLLSTITVNQLSTLSLGGYYLGPDNTMPALGYYANVTVLLIGFTVLTGNAQFSQSTRLDRHNIANKDPFAFTIHARHKTSSITFYVTVTRGGSTPASPSEVCAMLFDGEDEIKVMHLSPLRSTERTESYEFEIATNLLSHSQFVFRELRYTNDVGSKIGDSFWFFLRDFTEVGAPNEQGEANGRQPSGSETNRTPAPAASRRSSER